MINTIITQFDISNYDEVFGLWRQCEGVGLSDADSRESIKKYLERNPGMSFVASSLGEIVGAILAGHDGRRGYIHHLAVHPNSRRKGLARRLVNRSIEVPVPTQIKKTMKALLVLGPGMRLQAGLEVSLKHHRLQEKLVRLYSGKMVMLYFIQMMKLPCHRHIRYPTKKQFFLMKRSRL